MHISILRMKITGRIDKFDRLCAKFQTKQTANTHAKVEGCHEEASEISLNITNLVQSIMESQQSVSGTLTEDRKSQFDKKKKVFARNKIIFEWIESDAHVQR